MNHEKEVNDALEELERSIRHFVVRDCADLLDRFEALGLEVAGINTVFHRIKPQTDQEFLQSIGIRAD